MRDGRARRLIGIGLGFMLAAVRAAQSARLMRVVGSVAGSGASDQKSRMSNPASIRGTRPSPEETVPVEGA